ncbi:MAG: HAD hydrolase-like protein [Phycisphaerales bacterium]|nr:HAD hydrolase-like protein [Phycisphaerales bacterium]
MEMSHAAEASVADVAGKLASLDRFTVDMAATIQQCESLIESRLLEAHPQPVVGLESYLLSLIARGIPIAVVGQVQQRTVEALLQELDISDLIDVLVTHDDTRGHIPLLSSAATRMEVDLPSCLVIECTPGGVIAALAVGAACLALPTYYPQQLLVDAGANWFATDFNHLPGILRPAVLMAGRVGANDAGGIGGVL